MAQNAEQIAESDAANLDPVQVETWRDILERSGAAEGSLIRYQYDLMAVWRKLGDQMIGASWCNKPCTTEMGNYDCDAASTLNLGIRPKTITPAEVVIGAVAKLAEAADIARKTFFEGPFQAHCSKFRIPQDVAAAMKQILNQPGTEFNWFGGSPGLNPGIFEINQAARAAGHRTNLTDTGSRLHEPAFLERLVRNPPSLMALSADDFEGPADIRRLAGLSFEALRQERNAVNPNHGQRQKAYEAVYAAKLAAERGDLPPLLFNLVLHDGNLGEINETIVALAESFPCVRINPFPAQNGFRYGKEPAISVEHAVELRDFIDEMIDTQTAALNAGTSTELFTPRLPYWLMLRSVFDWAGDDLKKAMKMITGDGIWQCYRDSAAGFYVQVGLGPAGQTRQSEEENAGEHLGCYWNRPTITEPDQISDEAVTAQGIAQYIQIGKKERAANSTHPCSGCSFVRLVTPHILATEAGMNPVLLPFYFPRRMYSLGY